MMQYHHDDHHDEKRTMIAAPPPPPAYEHDNRPAGVWKLCDTDDANVSPWEPFYRMTWGRRKNVAEMEMDFTPANGVFSTNKFTVAMGGAVVGTFKPFNGSFVQHVDGKKREIVCMFDMDRRRGVQQVSFRWRDGVKYAWTASGTMSTVRGATFDSTTYTFHPLKQPHNVLASFAFLQPGNGMLDCCLRFFQQTTVPEQIVLTTLPVLMHKQWEEMLHEQATCSLADRLPTLFNVRDHFCAGRMYTYGASSAYEIDAQIHSIQQQWAQIQAQPTRPNQTGTASVTAGTASTSAVLSL